MYPDEYPVVMDSLRALEWPLRQVYVEHSYGRLKRHVSGNNRPGINPAAHQNLGKRCVIESRYVFHNEWKTEPAGIYAGWSLGKLDLPAPLRMTPV